MKECSGRARPSASGRWVCSLHAAGAMLSVHGKLGGEAAVVTGAASGVGRVIARAFAREGASVGLIARREEGLESAAREVRAHGVSAHVLPLDVSDANAVDLAAERVTSEWGKIDIWVNDAMVSVLARGLAGIGAVTIGLLGLSLAHGGRR